MIKKYLSAALALLMIITVIPFSLTACSEEVVGEIADIALELLEEDEETYTDDYSDEYTESDESEQQAEEEATEQADEQSDVNEAEEAAKKAEEELAAEEAEKKAEEERKAAEEAEKKAEEERKAAEEAEKKAEEERKAAEEAAIDENGSYDDKESVALYIHTYGKLPSNYITKSEAEALGWSGGSVEKYAKGKCIGGTYFGNYEGLLPSKKGRTYHECDIDTLGKSSRGAKRIIYSNDGLIYYTDDHYETFELLYGEE